jgi:hypothetical protein
MNSKGEVCPLSSQQISVIIDILRHQEQRITELEQTIKTWKISFYAGGFAIVTVFYVFDWFLTNSASIREMLQNFINKDV